MFTCFCFFIIRYKMVFIPFTGIDNHNRCVTFGGGLLSKETIKSYEWLLERFKIAFVDHPKILVTDQDPAIKQAIPAVFPNTRHRLCMWHIMQKFTKKVFLIKLFFYNSYVNLFYYNMCIRSITVLKFYVVCAYQFNPYTYQFK